MAIAGNARGRLLNGETTCNLVREGVLNEPAAILAARHEDDVFAVCFGIGIKTGNTCEHGLACGLECELDDFAFHKRQVDSLVHTPANGKDWFILADRLAAPATLVLKAFGTPSEQIVDLLLAPS